MGEKQLEDRKYTEKEYDRLTQELDYKIEYHAGYIRAIAGGHPNHNRAQMDFSIVLSTAFKDSKCEVFGSDQAVYIDKQDLYVYPDISVTCGDEEYTRDLYLNNPSIIVEVASKSTSDYDKDEKMAYYFTLPSLKEYIIISVAKPVVHVYSKENNKWNTSVFMGLQSKIYLPNFDLSFSMKDIYRRVTDLKDIQRK